MYNENTKKATLKYLAKLKEIRFRVTPEEYEEIQEAARAQGFASMRQFYLVAIHRMMHDQGVKSETTVI